MSRHNSSRRRNYGRRQHEVRERKRHDGWRLETSDDFGGHDGPGPRNPGSMFGFYNGRLSLEGNR